MKKFEFKLETVHKVREIRQDREAVILAELQEAANQAAQKVARIEAMRQKAIDNYTSRLASGEQLDAREMELNSNHFASLNRLQKDAEVELREKRHLCNQQIGAVTEAMRDVKITDRLRETQAERHRLEYSRQEQNGVDEHVSATFARRIIEAK